MMTEIDIVQAYERFWNCKNKGGYLMLDINGTKEIVSIKDILPTKIRKGMDRIIKTSDKDYNGKKVTPITFKISELVNAESIMEVPLLRFSQ